MIETAVEAVEEIQVQEVSIPELVPEAAIENVVEVEVQPEVVIEPVASMSLEDKVLNYINEHKGGVKVSQLEGQLGETRMKLGFTVKALLEEGKIQKIENAYYPLS